ncbi:MAG TPA: signal peptidase II [Novosphingobium sp.]|nr:signal peptidase II [Novosphingobium sp.]
MTLLARHRLFGLVFAGVIFAVDQFVKSLMTGPLALHQKGLIPLLPFFDLRWTENYGVSLGMLTARSMEMRWGLVAMTALIAAGVLIWLLRETAKWDIVALAMVLGGALGNIVDRYSLGFVIDYADLHFGEFRPFLIFNVADAAIALGVVLLLARSLLLREKPAKPEAAAPSVSSPAPETPLDA